MIQDCENLLGAFPPTDTVFVILGYAIVLSKDEQWCPKLARWIAIYPLSLTYQAVLSPEREAGSHTLTIS
jgi:hypothetical protein